MLRRIHGLYLIVGAIAGYSSYSLMRTFKAVPGDALNSRTFLQGRYWGDDAQYAQYSAACLAAKAIDCGELAFLEEKAGHMPAAKAAYQRGCSLGDQYSCQKANSPDSYWDRTDPLAGINLRHWPNGLDTMTLPDPKAKEFMLAVEVDAGSEDEAAFKTGVAHLTEHAIFRDPRLPAGNTYYDAIRSRDGEVNAYTMAKSTLYFAKVAPASAVYLTRLFAQMFSRRQLKPASLDKSKSEVLLERSGRDPRFYYNIPIPTPMGFEQREFGIKPRDHRNDEIRSTKALQPADVAAFYAAHYRPGAMTVFVTGKYDQASVMGIIGATFGTLAPGGTKTLDPKPHPVARPYVGMTSASRSSPIISIGTKYWNASAEDMLGMDVYVEYVAHRLMKEVRTLRGDTYTAQGATESRPWGTAFVRFEAKDSAVFPYIRLVNQTIQKETAGGRLSDDQLTEALWLYRGHFERNERNPEQNFAAMSEYQGFRRRFHTDATPFQIVGHMQPATLRQILKRHFKPERSYISFTNPVKVWDVLALELMLLIAPSLYFAWRRARPMPPARVLHLDRGLRPTIGWLVVAFTYLTLISISPVASELLVDRLPAWKMSLERYALTSNLIGIAAMVVAGVLVALRRGLTVNEMILTNEELMLTSRHRILRRVPLQAIAQITIERGLSGFDGWWVRAYFAHLEFWRQGVALRLVNGERVFFTPRQAEIYATHLRVACAQSSAAGHPAADPRWAA